MFNLTASVLYESDGVLSPLFNKYFRRYGALKVLSLLFIVPVILSYIAGYIEGTLFNQENLVGVIKDYTLYGLWLVVFISIYLYYKFSLFTKDFFEIKVHQIIDVEKINKEQLEQIDQKLSDIIGARGYFKYVRIILILVFIGFHILNVFNSFDPIKHYGHDIWHSANHPLGFAVLKLFNLLYSTILMSIFFYKFIASLLGISWLFKKLSKLNAFLIRPLSPDNAAGLKVLSNLSIHFMYMVLPFFLIFVTMILRGTNFLIGQQIAFLGLIILLFVTFFLPLGFVHSAMKRAKVNELENISEHFSHLNEEVKKLMKKNNYDDLFVTKINSLEKMDFLYTKTEKMPIWPFNLENLGKVLIASLIPVFVFSLELIINPESILYNFDKLIGLFNKLFN